MYTGFKELIAATVELDSQVAAAGLAPGAVYRADVVYETVEHTNFLVLRFGEPTARMGDSMIVPFDILGYCEEGNTDAMKAISAAARRAIEQLGWTATESGHFTTSYFEGIGPDQYDAGYEAIVLTTHMSCVGSGY